MVIASQLLFAGLFGSTAGDESAGQRSDRPHRFSVVITGVQLAGMILVLNPLART